MSKRTFKVLDKRTQNDKFLQMSFGDALNEILKGRHIRRLEWEDKAARLALIDEKLMVFRLDDKMFHPLIVSFGDIAAKDWVVAEEVQPTKGIPYSPHLN